MTQGVPETKWFSGWVRADYADRELTKEQGPKTSYEFDIPEKNCVKDFRYGTIRKPGYTRRALSRGGVRVMEGERETSGVLAVADLDEAVKNAQAKERSLDSDTRDPVVK
jgi:hypothetical protein